MPPFYFEVYKNNDRRHVWEHYPPYILSIAGSPTHYCEPRALLSSIEAYTTVEIAIMVEPTYEWASQEFLSQFPCFTGDDVAGYVSWDDVNMIRRRLELLSS